ncbi:ecdysone 20-monooxygenase [Agrilus planipennis]|uniref:Ecdysone 20-monooxygenase n=1 Tax=Agrilus planipennis TaxID=224129 RepID=A0A1W4X7G1_AGRPL|nr:ecdysone 20-monooxygenase [Agrilus planipennis]
MIETILNPLNLPSILVLIFTLFMCNWYIWKRVNKRQDVVEKGVYDIPGPVPLPFFGTRWLYSWIGGYKFEKIHEMYEVLFAKYGPIIKEEALWNYPIVSIKEREDIEKVLRSVGKYPLRPPTEIVVHYRKNLPDRYSSLGLVNEQGETWHHLRTHLTSELTSTRTISEFTPVVKDILHEWCDLIKQNRSNTGKIENVHVLAERFALEVTCALVLGRRMGFLLSNELSDKSKRLSRAVKEHFLASRDTYYGLPFWKLVPTESYSKFVKAQNEIYQIASELIQTADDSTQDSAVFQSVLHAPVDEKDKTTVIVDFIAAGIHTLANSLIFLLHLIGSNEDVQKTLKEHLKNGSNSYAKACVYESFRVIPTAPCIARILDKDLQLSGYNLKAGTVVLSHTGIACRDERYFPNAKKFDPGRWLNEVKGANVHSLNAFLISPFGVGKRICPGKRFSEMVVTVALEIIMEHFKLECKEPLELVFEFLLAPKSSTSIYFHDDT